MYLHKTKNGHYTPPCCYFSGELEVVECLSQIFSGSNRIRMALSKENIMAKNAHLVLDERATIEVRLRERASFTEIGRELGKDPSTISKEVRLHSQTVRKDSFNPCCKRSTCDEYGTACSKCKLMMSHINSYNRKR